jgi:hypothetical protein
MNAAEIADELFARAKQRTTRDEFHPRDLLTDIELVVAKQQMVAICYQFHRASVQTPGIVQKVRSGIYITVGGSNPVIKKTGSRQVMEF